MFFKSRKVQSKKSHASQVFPSHIYDQNSHPDNFSKTDTKFSQENYFGSPLFNLILNNESNFNLNTTASEKEILLKAWKESNILDDKNDKIKVSEAVSSKDLNLLKAKGLVAGSGSEVSLTPNGKKILVETILDAKSSFRKESKNNSNIRLAQNNNINSNMEKVKLVRSPEGKWVYKKNEEDNEPEKDNNIEENLENQSLATLKYMLEQVKIAKKDYFKYKTAGSDAWNKRYDIEKLSSLEISIENAIKNK